jgi:hypothetical protein
MNDEEIFWQGIKLAQQQQQPVTVPEFRAYYNTQGLVTHYTAYEFSSDPNNYIIVTESDYRARDQKQMAVHNGVLVTHVPTVRHHEFRPRQPSPGFTPDKKHANILYHDSD